jgi:tRNA pseudouridine(38-40) synthase
MIKYAKYKDSGVEWIGEIPAHWEVTKIKTITIKIGSGVTPKGGAEIYELSGIPLLRSQNIYFDGFRLENVAYITSEIHDSMKNSQVQSGDVLLNITGGSIGRCYFVTNEFNEANVNQHVCIVRPNERIITEFLYYILSSTIGQQQIDLCQTGGNREALNFEQLKNFFLCLPKVDEQKNIVQRLKTSLNNINLTIEKFRKEIELTGSSRTDAGVHALQNFFHFDENEIPTESFEKSVYHLNAIISADVVVKGITLKHEGSHSRFDAKSRRYLYTIYQHKDPFLMDRGYYFPYPLNMEKLAEAAEIIKQTNYFEAFSKKNTQVLNFNCTIFESFWLQNNNEIQYHVCGSRFLRGMVRGLVGTMLKVGTEKTSIAAFKKIIESGDVSQVDFSTPARGLMLVSVNY